MPIIASVTAAMTQSAMWLLDDLPLAAAYRARIESLRGLISTIEREVAIFERDLEWELGDVPGYTAIQEIAGVGPVIAAIFVAEIGDVTRFVSPRHLASWAGLTPRHRESDTSVHRGPITKQGSRLVRWAAVEAAQRQAAGTKLRADYARIAENHGSSPGARKIARVAVARKIVTLVYYGGAGGSTIGAVTTTVLEKDSNGNPYGQVKWTTSGSYTGY